MSYVDLDNLVRSNVQDDSGKLKQSDYASGISAAIKRYSKCCPVEICEDVPGTGTCDLPLPDRWQAGFSAIKSIEFPIGSIRESLLGVSDFWFYRSPTGLLIRLINMQPAITDIVRLTYTVAHDDTTIPDTDLETVAHLASSYCLLRLAAVYGNATDSTIQADSVQRQSKIDEYRRLADKFEGLFNQALGLNNNDTTSAAMTMATPVTTSHRRSLRWR